MELKEVISLSDVALRFAKAKGMQELGYQWLRKAPGRSTNKVDEVGNSLGVRKAIKAFNAANRNKISVYHAIGYDGTPTKTMVISKSEVIRLKGFVIRSAGKERKSKKVVQASFKILSQAEI